MTFKIEGYSKIMRQPLLSTTKTEEKIENSFF